MAFVLRNTFFQVIDYMIQKGSCLVVVFVSFIKNSRIFNLILSFILDVFFTFYTDEWLLYQQNICKKVYFFRILVFLLWNFMFNVFFIFVRQGSYYIFNFNFKLDLQVFYHFKPLMENISRYNILGKLFIYIFR